jgi:hypothetical protein
VRAQNEVLIAPMELWDGGCVDALPDLLGLLIASN